jgi:hypothetical protein
MLSSQKLNYPAMCGISGSSRAGVIHENWEQMSKSDAPNVEQSSIDITTDTEADDAFVGQDKKTILIQTQAMPTSQIRASYVEERLKFSNRNP